MNIVISSGHGKYVRGASGYLDEVDEARLVVERVADFLRGAGVGVKIFHDDVSRSQNENLNRIVSYHNGQVRDLDVSVHFNAYQTTSSPMGTECLYVTQAALSGEVAAAIASSSGLKNRGAKKRSDLYFLNNTAEPAILIEVCFVDSQADADIYRNGFEDICHAIAQAVSGQAIVPQPPEPEPPEPPEPEPGPEPERPSLSVGSSGPDVVYVQATLGIPADGDFGSVTEAAVSGYQAALGMATDGTVDAAMWGEIDSLDAKMTAGSNGLPASKIEAIVTVASDSELASYSWRDRGKAPIGYTAGMALAYALAATWLAEDDSSAMAMARADSGDTDSDALAWYRDEFAALDMDNSRDGRDTLRHLFVLLIGLGMRESSGNHWEGRDMSASNVSPDTAEAGLFQSSWNCRSCSSELPKLFERYWEDPNGFGDTFSDGVSPSSSNLQNYGDGDEGTQYQWLAKYCPAFACMTTAVGLRNLRQHWGPINRREAELRPEADALLKAVEDILAAPPEPDVANVAIEITATGPVKVTVNGQEIAVARV